MSLRTVDASSLRTGRGATIRAIAAAARVDPALVLHFFGSKEQLFVTAMQLPQNPAQLVPAAVALGIEGLGERLVTLFLETWDAPHGRPFLALMRSVAGNEKAAEMMREFVSREVLGHIAAGLDVERPSAARTFSSSGIFRAMRRGSGARGSTRRRVRRLLTVWIRAGA
jgi:AcrR family transcriptional regulator